MKKGIGLALLAGAAFFGYRSFVAWSAYKTYEKFADAWVRGDRAEAAKYGDADSVRYAFDRKAIRGTPSGSMIEAFRGTRYTVESRTRSPEGDVELEVRQTILFDPPGVTTGVGGAMVTHFHDAATVRKTPEGWRVVAFEPTYLDMGELRRGKP